LARTKAKYLLFGFSDSALVIEVFDHHLLGIRIVDTPLIILIRLSTGRGVPDDFLRSHAGRQIHTNPCLAAEEQKAHQRPSTTMLCLENSHDFYKISPIYRR